jgi:hypothetical protein
MGEILDYNILSRDGGDLQEPSSASQLQGTGEGYFFSIFFEIGDNPGIC